MPGIYNGLLQLDGIKMVNQLLAGVHIALAAEAMAFGARLGLILLQLVGVSEEKLITLLEQINNQTTRQTKVTVKLSGSISSQYLTALLMAAPLALGDVEIEIIDKLISIPYVDMTLKLMERFRVHVEHSGNWDRFLVHGGQKYKSPGNAFVEGDASSASYFLAGAAVTGGTITVVGCGTSSLQNHPAVVVPRLPAGLNLLSPDGKSVGKFVAFGKWIENLQRENPSAQIVLLQFNFMRQNDPKLLNENEIKPSPKQINLKEKRS
ncbi:hypothetical protein AHAS_Ahas14G0243300 [Arachis hypogaea]